MCREAGGAQCRQGGVGSRDRNNGDVFVAALFDQAITGIADRRRAGVADKGNRATVF